MEERTYQGFIYRRNGPGEAWQMAGPAAGSAPAGQIIRDPMQPVQMQAAQANIVNDAARLDIARSAEVRAGRSDERAAAASERQAAAAERQAAMAGLSPTVRADAITGYRSAQQLRAIIRDIEQLNAKGAGASSGLGGLVDYLPTESNKRLDAAGNAARGVVGTALGFTGGQLNTAAEAAAAVGPYLPQASDYDEVRLDKIQRLRELADNAEKRAIAQLGGVPDDNGRVTPIAAAITPPAASAPPPSSPTTPPAGNGAAPNQPGLTPGGEGRTFYTAKDQAVADEAQAAFVRGASRAELDAIAAKYGRQPFGPELDAALEARARGSVAAQFAATPTGKEDTGGLTGAVANALPSAVGSFVTGAGNATTFGQLENIAQGLGGSEGGVGVGMKLARDNPASFFAGSLVGDTAMALGTGGVMGKVASKVANPTIASLLAKPVTADVAFGAAQGAGNAEDPLYGAVGGALAGAAGSAGGSYLGRKIAGARKPEGIANLNSGERAVMAAVNRDNPDTVAAALARASELGAPANLADVSPSVNNLTGAAIRRSPVVAGQARNGLTARGRGQYDRLIDGISQNLGPVTNIEQRSEDLLKAAKGRAGPLYDEAYAQPGAGAMFPRIEHLLERPSMQDAMRRAGRLAREEGRDPTALGFDLTPEGETVLTRVPSWETLDLAKRGLDDVVQSNKTANMGRVDNEGRLVNNTLQEFLGTVDQFNPTYPAARAAYAGPVQERAFLEAGQEAVNMRPNELAVSMDGLTPERMGQMQLGFQSRLAENAGRLRQSSNPFESVLGTPAMEQRLATMYPSNPNVATLLAQRDLERDMAASANRLIGNSMTAERAVADEAFAANPVVEGALHGAAALASGGASLPHTAARFAGSTIKDKVILGLGKRATEKAEQIGPITMQNDPAATLAALQALKTRQQRYEVAKALLGEAGVRPGAVAGVSSVAALLGSMGE